MITITDTKKSQNPGENQSEVEVEYGSISDKIFRIQRKASSAGEKNGPSLHLFFHELKNQESRGKRVLDYIIALPGLLILALLFPIIGLGVKLSTRGSVIQEIPTEGRAGKLFNRLQFRLNKNANRFGSFLYRSGLYKLPNLINILKKEMHAVGPAPFDKQETTRWNNIYDDFYKRYAVAPGMIPIVSSNRKERHRGTMPDQLKKELKYVLQPTAKSDLRVIFGKF